MMQVTPGICKLHAVLHGIHARSTNMKISVFGYQSKVSAEDSKWVGWIQWWLQQLRSPTLNILIRTTHFWWETQVIMDNNPSNSIRSIARNMGMSEFLIWQVVYEGIHYFSYKIRNGKFLLQAMKDRKKNKNADLFEQTQTSPAFFSFSFLREKFFQVLDGELTEQLLACSVPTWCTDIDENQIPSPHHGVWGGYLQWWHYATIHLLTGPYSTWRPK